MSSSSLADAYTEVRMERITYTWTIKRFNRLPQGFGEKLCSPWFYSGDNSEKWRLLFYPRARRTGCSECINYVALYLARDSPTKSQKKVYAELKISKDSIVLRNSPFEHDYGPQDDQGFLQFLERSKLLTTNSSSDDDITISCIIDIPVEVTTSSFDAAIVDSKKSRLKNDLHSLLEEPIFSDFTIIVGDEKFPTHRNVLARRSSVFAAMFESKDLKDNREKQMKIENIEPDIIKGMLEFIYTDQVTNLKELASGLLEAANKYDLERLKAMCEKTLYEGLNEENAADVLLLADLNCADILKKYVIKYIVDHATEVVKSNNWTKISRNPQLLLELFNQSVLPQTANSGENQSSKA